MEISINELKQLLELADKDANTESRPQFPVPYPGVTIEYERDPLGECEVFAFTRRDAPRLARSVMVRVEYHYTPDLDAESAFKSAVAAIDRRGGFDAVARNREPGEEMYTLIVRSDDASTKNASVE